MEKIYMCRTCGKLYKSKTWLQKHIKSKKHSIAWINLVEQERQNEIVGLKQELQELKQMIMNLKMIPHSPHIIEEEWTIKRKRTIPLDINDPTSTRGSKADYRQVVNELKKVLNTKRSNQELDANELEIMNVSEVEIDA